MTKYNTRRSKRTRSKRTRSKRTRSKRTRSKRTRNNGGALIDAPTKNTLSILLANQGQRMSNVLSSVCKGSKDNCIALGTYDLMIYNFFNNFADFSLIVTQNTKRIGSPSNNGFIWSVPFEKDGYTAYTVLKCSDSYKADNLYYEYYVGKNFINKYTKKFPCFVETYGCYKLLRDKWTELKRSKQNVSFTTGIEKYTGGFVNSCTNNNLLSVLIQHFDNEHFKSLSQIVDDEYDNVKYEIHFLCYQVLFALSTLGNTYTHYDLHDDNVFCYKPYDGNSFIQMNYYLSDGTIESFPTQYIMKIIDYGRNYFNNGDTNTSQILQTEICSNALCNPNCGKHNGYAVIQGRAFNASVDFYDVYPDIPNQSHDLRFMSDKSTIKNYIKQVTGCDIRYKTKYGTPELLTSGLSNHQINNIHDAKTAIEQLIPSDFKAKINKKYDSTWRQVATMNIYQDGRDYEFIQIADPTSLEVIPPERFRLVTPSTGSSTGSLIPPPRWDLVTSSTESSTGSSSLTPQFHFSPNT